MKPNFNQKLNSPRQSPLLHTMFSHRFRLLAFISDEDVRKTQTCLDQPRLLSKLEGKDGKGRNNDTNVQ
jgi:hypothetical protein